MGKTSMTWDPIEGLEALAPPFGSTGQEAAIDIERKSLALGVTTEQVVEALREFGRVSKAYAVAFDS